MHEFCETFIFYLKIYRIVNQKLTRLRSFCVGYEHNKFALLHIGLYTLTSQWYKPANALKPFIHLAVCLTTGPKLLPKPALHIVGFRASSFKWEYPLLSLSSSSTFLRLLRCLPVTSIPYFISPSITCCRRQFLRKIWTVHLAFYFLISCTILVVMVEVWGVWVQFAESKIRKKSVQWGAVSTKLKKG